MTPLSAYLLTQNLPKTSTRYGNVCRLCLHPDITTDGACGYHKINDLMKIVDYDVSLKKGLKIITCSAQNICGLDNDTWTEICCTGEKKVTVVCECCLNGAASINSLGLH
jgi:hypothetical protein